MKGSTKEPHRPIPPPADTGIENMGPSPLIPAISLLVKLGSLAVHIDEYLSNHGHPFDEEAIKSLLNDEELKEWIKAMDGMAFLPVKRDK